MNRRAESSDLAKEGVGVIARRRSWRAKDAALTALKVASNVDSRG